MPRLGVPEKRPYRRTQIVFIETRLLTSYLVQNKVSEIKVQFIRKGKKVDEIAADLGISKSTLYRYLRIQGIFH